MTQLLDTATCPDASILAQVTGSHAVAVYIGGAGSAGHGWSPGVVDSLESGWVPIYVPAQSVTANAHDQALLDAADCKALLDTYPPSASVAFDIEASTVAAAPAYWEGYVASFVAAMQGYGHRAVLYTSLSQVERFASVDPPPPSVWVAYWVAQGEDEALNPYAIPGLPDNEWDQPGQRAWQYANNVQISGWNWDISVVDPVLVSAVPTPAPAEPTGSSTLTVQPEPSTPEPVEVAIQPGDTLWALAEKFHTDTTALYAANAAALDAAARAHGYPDSRQGALIWPGEVIKVP